MLAPYADKYMITMFTASILDRADGPRHFVPVKRTNISDLVVNVFAGTINSIALWFRARRIETELQELSDHMLEDIGVERGNIHSVSVKWASHKAVAVNDDDIEKAA